MRAAVVEPADGAEALLACGVPDLETDGGGCVGVGEAFGYEGGADGGGGGGGWEGEGWVEEAVYERGFADALGAEDDDFGFEGGWRGGGGGGHCCVGCGRGGLVDGQGIVVTACCGVVEVLTVCCFLLPVEVDA